MLGEGALGSVFVVVEVEEYARREAAFAGMDWPGLAQRVHI